jgi:hypothetical protein
MAAPSSVAEGADDSGALKPKAARAETLRAFRSGLG